VGSCRACAAAAAGRLTAAGAGAAAPRTDYSRLLRHAARVPRYWLIIAGKLRTGTIVGRQVSLDDVRDVIAYCLVRHNRHAGDYPLLSRCRHIMRESTSRRSIKPYDPEAAPG
jgi:hypothetical protein